MHLSPRFTIYVIVDKYQLILVTHVSPDPGQFVS